MASSEYAAIKVSRSVLHELERLRKATGAHSLEEVLRLLVRSYRRQLLTRLHGAHRGLSEFTEKDRGEEPWT